jgi:micrococcal nuclease
VRRRCPGAVALGFALLALAASAAAERGRTLDADVVRIVDGDTIHVRVGDRVEKVRYIGVNTPEVHHPTRGEEPGGRQASDVNRTLVDGRRVQLELDVRLRDRYGRLLAYVWVADVMVNAELVRLGYAQVMTVPPNVRYQALFLSLQRDAREAGRGLWRRASAPPPRRSAGTSWRAMRSVAAASS